MKKMISTLLIVILIAVQLVPILNVKAEGVEFVLSETVTKKDDPNSKLITNNDVTITVNGVDSAGSLIAYKIIDVFYNKETNEVSYQFTDSFQTFLDSNETYKNLTIDRYFELTSDNPDGSASTSVITTSELNKLLSEALINNVSGSEGDNLFDKGQEDENGNVTHTLAVEVGVYIVRAINTKMVYGVMSANAVPVVGKNGEWLISNPIITAKRSDVSAGNITIKNKNINMALQQLEIDAEYSVDLPVYPTNSHGNKDVKYVISSGIIETIKDGQESLTIDENGLVFKGNIQVATIESTVLGNEVLISDPSLFTSGTINIMFSVNLEELNLGSQGNQLTAVAIWNSGTYGKEYIANDIVTENIYVYAMGIQNLEKDTEDVLLNGANYEVYRSYDPDTNTLSDKVDIDFLFMDGVAMTFVFETGKYYFKQIKAPSGYRLSKDIIEIDVNPGSANETDDGNYAAVVYNEKMWFLPSTGGIGTIIYTLVGLMVVGLSTYGIVYYRKKRLTVN